MDNLISNVVNMELIVNGDDYYAHTHNEKRSETLKEHTEKTFLYFEKIFKSKGIGDFVARFEKLFFESDDECKSFFEKIFVNLFSFHDYGKINPRFQIGKMKNNNKRCKLIDCLDGANHSLLSSAIYVDYFTSILESIETTRREKEILYTFILINSYVISRHHGELVEFEDYMECFHDGGKINIIFKGFVDDDFKEIYKGPFYPKNVNCARKNQIVFKHFTECMNEEQKFSVFIYTRMLFSLLVSADYYATAEYESNLKMENFGQIVNNDELIAAYNKSNIVKQIRRFDPTHYTDDLDEINILRNLMFYEAERNISENKNIFFLEAPTGGGKSNIALNCSLKLLDDKINKIFYVYPFNTLVEQNMESLNKIFADEKIMNNIVVLNSVTPMKIEKGDDKQYQKALLDRQFINYPFILTTHVNLFQMIFGNEREAAMCFYQLSNSVIVLDEIQSYKNTIWTEIILFLNYLTKLLNIKIIIMSATLPKLDYLTDNVSEVGCLLKNREKYFLDPRFKNRVNISYELLEINITFEILISHILERIEDNSKILVEFINKKSAEQFYREIKDKSDGMVEIELITGDYNMYDRKKILKKVKLLEKPIILVATQVIEAGVDIDMSIGYKDISKLDSDEQFLGRINRNYRKSGMVYFFDLDACEKIYKNDFRTEAKLTLHNDDMKKVFLEKDFDSYYKQILNNLKKHWNELSNENGINAFVNDEIAKLNFTRVNNRMKLIDDDNWTVSVFFARNLEFGNGSDIWNEYKQLIYDTTMDYSEKRVRLSQVRSKLSLFVYEVNKNADFNYNDKIGELYYIENGEDYLVDDKFDRCLFEKEGGLIV